MKKPEGILLVVDVQPFYESYHTGLGRRIINHIRENGAESVIWMFNGDEVGTGDNEYSLTEYVLENGGEDILDLIEFKEKDYGFLRGWMDTGREEQIVPALKSMIKRGLWDSRDLDGEDDGDCIGLPSWDFKDLLLNKFYSICGGGENECLWEMELLLEAFGVETEKINHLIY